MMDERSPAKRIRQLLKPLRDSNAVAVDWLWVLDEIETLTRADETGVSLTQPELEQLILAMQATMRESQDADDQRLIDKLRSYERR